MKKLSIFFLAAFFMFACDSNKPATDTTEVVANDAEVMATEEPMATAEKDIVALASETPSLSTLVKALQAADLVTALQGPGPFTVFAPTDEAFAALPAGTLENLLKPENKQQLIDILTYHVVEGEVMAANLSNNMMAKTLNGEELKVMLDASKVMINDANVTMPNVDATNGVVHVIDKVMLPAGK